MVSDIADQALKLMLDSVEDAGNGALDDLSLIRELPRCLSFVCRKSIVAGHLGLPSAALGDFVFLDVSVHDLAIEGKRLLLGQLIRQLTFLRLHDISLIDAHNVRDAVIVAFVPILGLLA